MTIYEALKLNACLLEALKSGGINVGDVEYLSLYEDFEKLNKDGLKSTYITAYLTGQYEVSERTVWRIVKKFRRTLKVP